MPDNLKQGCAPSECGTKSACAGCSSNPHAQPVKKDPPKVKKVIGVISGKGGVGKSLVSGELAVMLRRLGLTVGIMDADITGPSIPHMFGVHEKAMGTDTKLFPVKTTNDIEMMSINLMLETDDTPVIWRGPVIAGVVTQFWEDVDWSELDCMVIDMPPGTGDVPLTVFQSIPLDGVIIVTTPQDLVEMIVSKAVNMAKMMNIPVLGLVENMSYAVCPDCGRHIEIFGHSKIDELAARYSIPVLAKLPMDPNAAALCDEGKIERVVNPQMEDAAKMLAANFNLL